MHVYARSADLAHTIKVKGKNVVQCVDSPHVTSDESVELSLDLHASLLEKTIDLLPVLSTESSSRSEA